MTRSLKCRVARLVMDFHLSPHFTLLKHTGIYIRIWNWAFDELCGCEK